MRSTSDGSLPLPDLAEAPCARRANKRPKEASRSACTECEGLEGSLVWFLDRRCGSPSVIPSSFINRFSGLLALDSPKVGGGAPANGAPAESRASWAGDKEGTKRDSRRDGTRIPEEVQREMCWRRCQTCPERQGATIAAEGEVQASLGDSTRRRGVRVASVLELHRECCGGVLRQGQVGAGLRYAAGRKDSIPPMDARLASSDTDSLSWPPRVRPYVVPGLGKCNSSDNSKSDFDSAVQCECLRASDVKELLSAHVGHTVEHPAILVAAGSHERRHDQTKGIVGGVREEEQFALERLSALSSASTTIQGGGPDAHLSCVLACAPRRTCEHAPSCSEHSPACPQAPTWPLELSLGVRSSASPAIGVEVTKPLHRLQSSGGWQLATGSAAEAAQGKVAAAQEERDPARVSGGAEVGAGAKRCRAEALLSPEASTSASCVVFGSPAPLCAAARVGSCCSQEAACAVCGKSKTMHTLSGHAWQP